MPYKIIDGNGETLYQTENYDVNYYWNYVGVDKILTDAKAPAEFFNLQGVRVDPTEAAPGIYIKRVGSATEKVYLR